MSDLSRQNGEGFDWLSDENSKYNSGQFWTFGDSSGELFQEFTENNKYIDTDKIKGVAAYTIDDLDGNGTTDLFALIYKDSENKLYLIPSSTAENGYRYDGKKLDLYYVLYSVNDKEVVLSDEGRWEFMETEWDYSTNSWLEEPKESYGNNSIYDCQLQGNDSYFSICDNPQGGKILFEQRYASNIRWEGGGIYYYDIAKFENGEVIPMVCLNIHSTMSVWDFLHSEYYYVDWWNVDIDKSKHIATSVNSDEEANEKKQAIEDDLIELLSSYGVTVTNFRYPAINSVEPINDFENDGKPLLSISMDGDGNYFEGKSYSQK